MLALAQGAGTLILSGRRAHHGAAMEMDYRAFLMAIGSIVASLFILHDCPQFAGDRSDWAYYDVLQSTDS